MGKVIDITLTLSLILILIGMACGIVAMILTLIDAVM